jgi:hypothetical protein
VADVGSIIVAITLFIIFGIFLCYDFFRKGEKFGFLAYIAAVAPINYLWGVGTNVLIVYVVLFSLWILCLLRDLLFVYRKDKEYDDILLFLGLGILIQIVLTSILPQMNPLMKKNTVPWLYFYFPDVYNVNNNIQSWVSSSYLLAFRLTATLMIILAIIPMILDLKSSEEKISLLALIVIDLIFILPFLWLAFIWAGGIGWPLTFLFSVILLIVLLMLTREK